MLRELSLFTGYGGFTLGLRLAGLEVRTVGYVEIETYCQGVIKARIKDGLLDDAPIWDDIRTFRGGQFRGLVDIVTAGFPCQPHSAAGRRKGESDERNLWPDTRRVISEIRPSFVLLENVPGLLTETNGGGFIPGWLDRWRRHNQYLGEAWKTILPNDSAGDERKGPAIAKESSQQLWRQCPPIQASKFCLECWMDLVYLWGRGKGSTSENPFEPTVETTPGDTSPSSVLADQESRKPQRETKAVDHRSAKTCVCACRHDEGVEQEGARGSFGDGEVPSDFRPEQYLGYPPTRFPGYAGTVVGQLSALGYDCRTRLVPAAAVGAPHLRWRWWCLAYARCISGDGVQPERISGSQETASFGSSGEDVAHAQRKPRALRTAEGERQGGPSSGGTVAHTRQQHQQLCGGRTRPESETSREDVADSHGARPPDIQGQRTDSHTPGRNQPGAGGWWAVEPPLGRVAHGTPNRVGQLRALGNGVVPEVVAEFLRRVREL